MKVFQKIRYRFLMQSLMGATPKAALHRLLLSNLLVLAIVLSGSAFVVRLVFIRNLQQQLIDRLSELAQAAAASAEFDKGYLESEAKFSPKLLSDRALALQWFDTQGNLLEQQGNFKSIENLPLIATPTEQIQTTLELQIVTLPILNSDNRQIIGYIRVSQSLGEIDATIARLDKGLTAGAMVAIVLSSLGSFWLNQMAMQPIEESFKRLRDFTADASHELRSPLMAISTNAEVALTYDNGMRASDGEKFKAIALAAEQMSQLTEDLLLLARFDRVTDFESKRINLTTLLLDLVNLYQPQAQTKQIELKADIGANLWTVGDEAKLARAFTNLIQNALQYTPAQGKVELKSKSIGRELLVTIEDTGIGIAPEHLDRVFDRLWRGDSSRSYYEGGSGLGLAITQAIIHNHHGTITVISQLKVGSRFVVSLPGALNFQ